MKHLRTEETDMPLRPARVGRVGVIGHPVAKTAVVAKAVSPGPSPVAKTAEGPGETALATTAVFATGCPMTQTAVVAKAVSPGPSPVAKTAVVAAAVTPGRR